jgi:hypothetical protein
MNSKFTSRNKEIIQMNCKYEVQKTIIDELSLEMIDMNG